MSATHHINQRWSNFGSSTSTGSSASYRSVSVSPSLFLTVSQTKLHTFATDLLYPTSPVPAAPKDSSELLRRGLLISNAMDAAKKQIKIERKASYDEARYTKRNTSSRGHLRGSARSASSSLHSTPPPITRQHGSIEISGSIHEPTVANALDAEEGEEWFEETWRELMDEDERDAAFSNSFKSTRTTTITVQAKYEEFSTTNCESVSYTNADAIKSHTEVQVLPVDSEEESPSSSPESSRATSPVPGEQTDSGDASEVDLIGIRYTQPVAMPSQLLGISPFTLASDDIDVPELSLGDDTSYEHDMDDALYFVRSDASSSPRKPRLLPTVIRDKFYEPSRFEHEVAEEDIALANVPVDNTSIVTFDDFMSSAVDAEGTYDSSSSSFISSESEESEDDDDLDEVCTPEEDASDEFGTAGDTSFGVASSFDDSTHAGGYFATGYNPVSKASFNMSDAEWDSLGREIPHFS
ncbi:hypothetical protein QFC19_004818 [Naganishia cerealis]|uniref:Uncharacterized protein n=1 Tax=Naganishia cerealis TaxID=610337 RepID=A0ACC2VTQ7_9TREE|nr:hypothetical protein QFC19_004818 [Naganishia cerealis]